MIITVCNQQFDTKDIKMLDIKEGRVFIETEEDFFNIRYTSADEIEEAKNYLKFQTLTRKQLIDAVEIIMITCDYFINEKEQCTPCPLKKKKGCIFGQVPIEWRD